MIWDVETGTAALWKERHSGNRNDWIRNFMKKYFDLHLQILVNLLKRLNICYYDMNGNAYGEGNRNILLEDMHSVCKNESTEPDQD